MPAAVCPARLAVLTCPLDSVARPQPFPDQAGLWGSELADIWHRSTRACSKCTQFPFSAFHLASAKGSAPPLPRPAGGVKQKLHQWHTRLEAPAAVLLRPKASGCSPTGALPPPSFPGNLKCLRFPILLFLEGILKCLGSNYKAPTNHSRCPPSRAPEQVPEAPCWVRC